MLLESGRKLTKGSKIGQVAAGGSLPWPVVRIECATRPCENQNRKDGPPKGILEMKAAPPANPKLFHRKRFIYLCPVLEEKRSVG